MEGFFGTWKSVPVAGWRAKVRSDLRLREANRKGKDHRAWLSEGIFEKDKGSLVIRKGEDDESKDMDHAA
jgi:hypothetical protein